MTFYFINVLEDTPLYIPVTDKVPEDVKVIRKINHFSQLRVGDMVQIQGKHYLVIDSDFSGETVYLFSLDKKYDNLEFDYCENFDIIENITAFPSNHDLKVGDKVQIDNSQDWTEEDEIFEVVAVYPENNVIDVYNKGKDTIKTVAQFCTKLEKDKKITCYITRVEPQVTDGYLFEFLYKDDTESVCSDACPITLFLKYYDAYWLVDSEKRNPDKNKIIRQTLESIIDWMKKQGVIVSYRNLKTILCDSAKEMFDRKIEKLKLEITSDNV